MNVAAGFVHVVANGPLLLAMAVAAIAGLVSFLSPCCLPLVPGYLSFVTGLSGADLQEPRAAAPTAIPGGTPASRQAPRPRGAAGTTTVLATPVAPVIPAAAARRRRGRVLAGSVLFVAGFSAVFVTGGALFGGLGGALIQYKDVVDRVLGLVTVVLGLAFLGLVPGLAREMRVHRLPRAGLAGAPLLGVLFGVGWTPCLGPTLGAVQTLAYTQASAGRGALLTAAYCAGLGLPFIATGLAFRRALGAFAVLRRHSLLITRIGGGLLVVIGVMLLSGAWEHLMIVLREIVAGYTTPV